MQEYVVRERARVVEAWSSSRLQFEPKGWQVDFRRELRATLGCLESDGGFLSARYVSSLSDRCDVENILFYNVGSGFSKTAAMGVQFERVYAEPPEPPVPMQALHYHRYEPAAPETQFALWRAGELIARFADVHLRRLSAETKVSEVWQALREDAAGDSDTAHTGGVPRPPPGTFVGGWGRH